MKTYILYYKGKLRIITKQWQDITTIIDESVKTNIINKAHKNNKTLEDCQQIIKATYNRCIKALLRGKKALGYKLIQI